MEIVTFLLGVAGFSLVLFIKPQKGLFVYLAGLFWYSQYLTVSIGTVDFTVGRIIIIGLFLNIFLRTKLYRNFKWNLLDSFMIAFTFSQLLALTISDSVPVATFIERQGGGAFDTVLPYFLIRIVITSKESTVNFIKYLIIIATPLALIGVFQCFTGIDILGFTTKYFAWGEDVLMQEMGNRVTSRFGLYRAYVTFGVPIIYGLFLAGVAPLTIGLLKLRISNKPIIIFCLGLILFGILSAMSAAPLYSIIISLLFLACYKFRNMWFRLYIIFGLLASILFIQAYTNRPFYEYFTKFSFDRDTAYYRINLVKEAFSGGMKDHWVAGYGYVGFAPDAINKDFDWEHKDIVNFYIGLLVRFGLLGLLPFLAINILIYHQIFKALKSANNAADSWLIWCILSTMLGYNFAILTVGVLEQLQNFFYMIIALCVYTQLEIKSAEDPGYKRNYALP